MSSLDLDFLFEEHVPRSHPGFDLIEAFVDEGEHSLDDVIDAWRTAGAIAAAFLGVTTKELLRTELWGDLGLDVEVPEDVREYVRQKLVGEWPT